MSDALVPVGRPTAALRPAPRERRAVSARAVLGWWPTVVFFLLAGWVVAWVGRELFVTQVGTYNARSDFWEHAGVLRALIDDPWHPGNPHLDSAAASSRYMPHFLGIALLARLAALDAFGAMALAGTLNLVILVLGIFGFFSVYFRDRRAPLYGLVVVLGSWYGGFRFSNVYQLSMLLEIAGYPSTAAVAFTFVSFALAVRVLRGPPSVGWTLALGAVVVNTVLTHPLTAVATVVGVMAMGALEPEVRRRRRALVVGIGATAFVVAELWPYFSLWRTLLNGEELDTSWVVDGLQALAGGESRRGRHLFYSLFPLVRTIGFAWIGVHALSCFVFSRRHRFVVVGALVMLAPFVINVHVKLPLGHRFILLAIPFLQIGTVWVLLKLSAGFGEGAWLPRGPSVLARLGRIAAAAMVGGLLLAMAWVNVSSAQRVVDRRSGARRPIVELCEAVAKATGPRAVVLGDPGSTWSLGSCGTKVVALLHPNPLVGDQRERGERVREFLDPKTTAQKRRRILEQYRVTHVLTHGRTHPAVTRYLSSRASKRRLRGGFVLHTLNH